ncbi:MAG: hypothetical protein JWR75_543 [Devosia sp.]|nr:hypothetical protein [Devosia sp.]
MKRILATAAVLLIGLGARPALATEWIVCSSADGEASIALLVGHLSFLAINRANFQVGDESWSTNPELEPGTPILVAQAYESETTLDVDLADVGFEAVLASLQVVMTIEGDDYISGGVLRVSGKGAWVVTCEGP